MFTYARTLFTALIFSLATVLLLLHHHGRVADVLAFVNSHAKKMDAPLSKSALNNNYTLAVKDGGVPVTPPALPDISGFTVDKIAALAPAYAPGRVSITGMAGYPGLREFIKKDGRVQRLRLSQLAVTPQVINIEAGSYDFAHLYEEVQKVAPQAIVKRGGYYLLRMPILVGEGASLTVSDKDTAGLLLSQDQSAFIANAGDLSILRTKVVGWSEKNNKPAAFKDRTIFRPFLVSWSGGRMHLAGSVFANLGYRKGKSYGITYSSCEPCLAVRPTLPRATGTLVGNTFTQMYYGFYSYEADDIAIVGNIYVNNVVYGIDPHDRSRRLIIANNDASGSGKKHGIIISRNVNDSWIFNNYTHHNRGAGIMLDRSCERNIVANNVSAYNAGDGVTFFESQNNTLYNNAIYRNALSGVRIRNSWNIRMAGDRIADNGGVPVVAYSMDLLAAGKERDVKQDPYEARVGATVAGSAFRLDDRKPAFKLDGVESLTLSGIHLVSGGPVFAGQLFDGNAQVRAHIGAHEKSLIFTNDPAPRARLSER